MYHLKVVRDGKMIVIQIGCVDAMRNFTLGLIDYALDRDEFHSFEKSAWPLTRSDEEVTAAQHYIAEFAELTGIER